MPIGSRPIRVVACLVEKQRTTPDQYPLTLNSLRLACNQSTNRDPVVDYDDSTIRAALDRLRGRQTPGELRPRTERMYQFESNEELDVTLSELIERELIKPLPRRPGERGQRYAHLLAGDEAAEASGDRAAASPGPAAPAADGGVGERVDRLQGGVWG